MYLSSHGTPVEGQPMGIEDNRNRVGIKMSALGNTVLVPENMSQIKNPTSWSSFKEKGELEPDFYMPDGKGSKLSESQCMYTTEKTPEDNPGVLVKLYNLEKKYGTSMYLLYKRSGHLYITETDGCKRIEEKGLLYPSESMILAGALNEDRGEPQSSIQVSKIQATPTAESTRIPFRTSTDKMEASIQKEPLSLN